MLLRLPPIVPPWPRCDRAYTSIAAGAPAGRADERAGPHLHAEHRGGHRAAEEGEGAHHGDRLPQREADPAHRGLGVPRRRRRDRGGASAFPAVRRQAPHGQALLGAQRLNALASISSEQEEDLKEYILTRICNCNLDTMDAFARCWGGKGSEVVVGHLSDLISCSTMFFLDVYKL